MRSKLKKQTNRSQSRQEQIIQSTNAKPASVPIKDNGAAVSCVCDGLCPNCISEDISSKGRPLSGSDRYENEAYFGTDLSSVRVYDQHFGKVVSQSHDASAVAYGNAVFIDSSDVKPGTVESKATLSHELAHVVQQKNIGSRVQCLQRARGGITQKSTLSQLEGNYNGMEKFDLHTSPKDLLDSKKEEDTQLLLGWFLVQLGEYQNQIDESAWTHKIPPQLIAAVILNELADISIKDIIQEKTEIPYGSVGPAQINIKEAMRKDLVTMPGDDKRLEEAADESYRDAYTRFVMPNKKVGKALIQLGMVSKRLKIPQFAIEAAAREIERLVKQVIKHNNNPWQKANMVEMDSKAAALRHPLDIYRYVNVPEQRRKEAYLARLISAAYNSPQIIQAVKKASITSDSKKVIYKKALNHGMNAAMISNLLYDNGLFHSFAIPRKGDVPELR